MTSRIVEYLALPTTLKCGHLRQIFLRIMKNVSISGDAQQPDVTSLIACVRKVYSWEGSVRRDRSREITRVVLEGRTITKLALYVEH